MKHTILILAALWLAPLSALHAATEGERLYNGIVLPTVWPPNEKPKGRDVRKPPEVPYLQNRPAVVPIDVGRQLFVDDFLIEHTTLKRQFHYPQRYEGNPILKAETPIELNGGKLPMAAMISDGVCYDPQARQFKLWYEAGWRDGTMLATSRDGLHFTRPNLDVEAGSNRVLPTRKRLVRHGTGIFQDLWTANPLERFKMTIYENDSGKDWAYTSPDGIHWTNRGAVSECGDNTTLFYNPFRKKWVYSIRQDYFGRMRCYRECDDFVAGKSWEKPMQPGSEAVYWAHADDLDPPDPELVRMMARLKSDPNASKTLPSGRAIDYDVTTQLYNVDAVAYESLMLGVFAIHRGPENHFCYEVMKGPKACDLVLAYSRDGFHWDRPDRTAFLAGSRKPGDWERGYLHAGVGLCAIVGDQLYFYYSGWSGEAPDPNTPWSMYGGGATGVAFLRRDGFVSMDADERAGTLTTRPVTFNGKYLFVNLDAPKGELRAEVLDENGAVLAPFMAANCVPASGDQTCQRVTWNGAPDLAKLSGRKVRFRLTLRNGRLYSFWVTPSIQGASHGYVAAGGPGFIGPIDR